MLPRPPQELVSSPGVIQVITKEVTNIPEHMFPFLQANESFASTSLIQYIFERTRESISIRGKLPYAFHAAKDVERAVEKLGKKLVKRTISSVPASQHHLLTEKALFEKGRCIVSKSKYPLNEIVVWCEAGREADVQRAITEVGKSQYTSTYSAALRSGIKQYISRPEFPEDIMADNEGLERCYVPVHLADPGKSNLNIDFAGTREAVDAAFVQVVDLLERVKVSTLEVLETLPPERLTPIFKQRADEFYDKYNVIIYPEPARTTLIFDPITAIGRKRFTKRHEYLQKAREILAFDKTQSPLELSCEQNSVTIHAPNDLTEPARKRRKLDSPAPPENQGVNPSLAVPSNGSTGRAQEKHAKNLAGPIKSTSTNPLTGVTKVTYAYALDATQAPSLVSPGTESHRGPEPITGVSAVAASRPQAPSRHTLPPKPVMMNNLDNAGAKLDVKNRTLEQANETLQNTINTMKLELSRFQTTADELLQKNRSLEQSNTSLSDVNAKLSNEMLALQGAGGHNQFDPHETLKREQEPARNGYLPLDLLGTMPGPNQIDSSAQSHASQMEALRSKVSAMNLELQEVKQKLATDAATREAEKEVLQTELRDARAEIQDLTTMYDAGEAYRQQLFQDLEAARNALADAGLC